MKRTSGRGTDIFGLRRRHNASTGVTPSHLLFGKAISAPGEWRFQSPDERNQIEAKRQREEEARRRQTTYQAHYAANPITPNFAPGDWVNSLKHKLSDKPGE